MAVQCRAVDVMCMFGYMWDDGGFPGVDGAEGGEDGNIK